MAVSVRAGLRPICRGYFRLRSALPVRVIDGYKGTSDIRLATESGELAGSCLSWDSYKTTWRKAIETGDVNVIIQVMPKKHPELANVPLAMDYAKTDEAKRLIKHGAHDLRLFSADHTFSARHAPKARVQVFAQGLCGGG